MQTRRMGDYATVYSSPAFDIELEEREVLVGGLPDRAIVHPDPRPLAIRDSALRTVIGALREFDIDYFIVPGFNDRGSTVAIREEDRTKASAALRESFFGRPARITQMLPKSNVSQVGVTTADRRGAEVLRNAAVLRLFWLASDVSGALVFGAQSGVEIEFWAPRSWREGVHSFTHLTDEDRASSLEAPRPNRAASVVDSTVRRGASDSLSFTRLVGVEHRQGVPVRTVDALDRPLADQVRFPIDVVFTWVDSSDAEWIHERSKYDIANNTNGEAASAARYLNRDELRYALRSIYANAPWVNHIYIVTSGHRPSWLDEHPSVSVVTHDQIFEDPSVLPVFNSHAIEANIHRIPDLSEHFIYFNDDMFIGRAVSPETFFQSNGSPRFFPSRSRVPFAAPSPNDSPVDAATKNGRALLQDDFGVAISQVMEHAPYALRRSVLEEMADRYSETYAKTSASRFRSAVDLNTLSNFAHHYGYLTERAVPASLLFTYVGLSVRDLSVRLDRMLVRRDRDAFCLNDTFTHEDELESQLEVVMPFLESYFPVQAPWER